LRLTFRRASIGVEIAPPFARARDDPETRNGPGR
jgi:hypothetical protein